MADLTGAGVVEYLETRNRKAGEVPTLPLWGPGSILYPVVTFGGEVGPISQRLAGPVELGGHLPVHVVDRSSLHWAPGSYVTRVLGLNTPTTGNPYFNVIIGPDAKTTGTLRRNTVLGALAFSAMEDGQRCEAIGQATMRFARLGNRNSGFGSLVMQWMGQRPENLQAMFHDFWIYNPGSGVVHPGQVGWDFLGLETANPGISAWIAAVTAAASSAEGTENVGVGRDALLHIIKGNNNTGVGYQALAHLYSGSRNTASGSHSLRDNVRGNDNTALGRSAGVRHQQGDNNVYVGERAGGDHVVGDGMTIVGAEAARDTSGWTAQSNTTLIGYGAGVGVTARDNAVIFQNDPTREPNFQWDDAEAIKPRFRDGWTLPLTKAGPGASHTGNTSKTEVGRVTIPGGSAGANGFVEIIHNWVFTGSANAKRMYVEFGGTAFFDLSIAAGTTVTGEYRTVIHNNASASAQRAHGVTAGQGNSGWGNSTVAAITAAVNTASDQDIVFYAELANAGETLRLNFYEIKLHFVA